MSELKNILRNFREAAKSEREAGEYFERLTLKYFQHESAYRDRFSDVWLYSDWAREQGRDERDVGIDLVARAAGTGEFYAIQCKFYAEDHRLRKSDIDSFFTASGQAPFSHRIIVSTTNNWSPHAESALKDQQPPVTKIDLHDLENSQIDWARYKDSDAPVLKAKKSPYPHQQAAIENTIKGLRAAENFAKEGELDKRGKLIMACGTGKTFTSLKIAEEMVGAGGRVLFLVPSLALLSQSLSEWSQESRVPLHSFAVCSDSHVGKNTKAKNAENDDSITTFVHELSYPATTNAKSFAREVKSRHDDQHMSVVFSTYHSIDVISEAHKKHDLGRFDLIICDEAHRTTGATFLGDDESHFVKVHDAEAILADYRLYMTATPRIYGTQAKVKAEEGAVELASMDDVGIYGKTLHTINFSEAVERGLLVDYKVIVLSVEESLINRRLQHLLADSNNSLKVDDAARIVGCWKALAKQDLREDLSDDFEPMRRAVAFCQVIEEGYRGKTHKVSSKQIAGMFQKVVEAYQASEVEAAREQGIELDPSDFLQCEAEHVDGGMNAEQKKAKLDWLKSDADDNTCRILSNVRCLSEGVDVPALDAVLFLSARSSQVDVVQSVGRVMRRAPGKTRGYVILPVVIPAGVEPHEALNDNRTYNVVWQVLNALRSHDDRFDALINKLDLIGSDPNRMEVVAVTDTVQPKGRKKGDSDVSAARGSISIGESSDNAPAAKQLNLRYEVGELERAITAKLVEKVGNRHHWEDWAHDIAKIVHTHIDRIKATLESKSNQSAIKAFDGFAKELRENLNPSVSDDEIVEMLGQHMVTKPVFDALFSDYDFVANNPMSQALDKVLAAFETENLGKEADTLQGFYRSVKLRAEGIDSALGRQKIIVELYDKFFRKAFPEMVERLGIVYTPTEIVDFILHSVSGLLKKHFNQTLGSPGVHIIDPFTGTGTFITRLLQSGLISKEELAHKYANEIHANELVLLAYYIAAVNIESAYHDIVGGEYEPFEGICLTDTFQMYETGDLVSRLLEENSERRKRQKSLDLKVIVANPPYSSGQDNANDNNPNFAYPHLDGRIAETYARRGNAVLKNALYDSYIRAIRWASDRLEGNGVIGYITNAGFLDGAAADGLRKCLAEEFASLYVFHLRGNARTAGEQRRKERDNVFGIGCRAPVAISFLVKDPDVQKQGQIHFYDIGDYLSREEKLEKISNFVSIEGIKDWKEIIPDEHGDWLNQRDPSFDAFMPLGAKKSKEQPVFENYSRGVTTSRDAWACNSSKAVVASNMKKTIAFYNAEVARFQKAYGGKTSKEKTKYVSGFLNTDSTKISWIHPQRIGLVNRRHAVYSPHAIVKSLYRPFNKQWLYFDRFFNNRVYQIPHIFPSPDLGNLVIHVSGVGARSFSALMSKDIPCLDNIEKGQAYPLYLYESSSEEQGAVGELFTKDQPESQFTRKDAITDEAFTRFKNAYPEEYITKEDIFYYIYGLLHSPDYRSRYANNLSKELPRIPLVKTADAFTDFVQAGRDLAHYHLHYESVARHPVRLEFKGELKDEDYRVTKMKFGKKKDPETGKSVNDLSTVIYNSKITIKGIPERAWNYVVNNKPALQWVMERQAVTTDKRSGITNDANDWAIETMNNPKYPLELFLRVITVSLSTLRIVKRLPPLDIAEGGETTPWLESAGF